MVIGPPKRWGQADGGWPFASETLMWSAVFPLMGIVDFLDFLDSP